MFGHDVLSSIATSEEASVVSVPFVCARLSDCLRACTRPIISVSSFAFDATKLIMIGFEGATPVGVGDVRRVWVQIR